MKRPASSGSRSTSFNVALSLLTIGAGVPGGAEIAFHVSEIRPGKPSSTVVGASGSSGMRFVVVTARMRALPPSCSLMAEFELHENQIDVPRNEIVQRGASALVGHVSYLRAGQLGVKLGGEM